MFAKGNGDVSVPELLFDPRYADTTFRMDNVHHYAREIGAALGVKGPYFFDYRQPDPGHWTFSVAGQDYTIDARQYRQIVTRKITAEVLAADMLISRVGIAAQLCRMVSELTRTGAVRAMAFDMEVARVATARGLAPRRAELGLDGTRLTRSPHRG